MFETNTSYADGYIDNFMQHLQYKTSHPSFFILLSFDKIVLCIKMAYEPTNFDIIYDTN